MPLCRYAVMPLCRYAVMPLCRYAVMYSRPVTQDDKIYLVSETTRIIKAMELDSKYAEAE